MSWLLRCLLVLLGGADALWRIQRAGGSHIRLLHAESALTGIVESVLVALLLVLSSRAVGAWTIAFGAGSLLLNWVLITNHYTRLTRPPE